MTENIHKWHVLLTICVLAELSFDEHLCDRHKCFSLMEFIWEIHECFYLVNFPLYGIYRGSSYLKNYTITMNCFVSGCGNTSV